MDKMDKMDKCVFFLKFSYYGLEEKNEDAERQDVFAFNIDERALSEKIMSEGFDENLDLANYLVDNGWADEMEEVGGCHDLDCSLRLEYDFEREGAMNSVGYSVEAKENPESAMELVKAWHEKFKKALGEEFVSSIVEVKKENIPFRAGMVKTDDLDIWEYVRNSTDFPRETIGGKSFAP